MDESEKFVEVKIEDIVLLACKGVYGNYENPLFAWFAYRVAREFGIDVPEWVLAYFDGVAHRLKGLDVEDGRIRDQLGPALGLSNGRGGSDWAKSHKQQVKMGVMICYLAEKKRNPTRSNFDIFSQLACDFDLEHYQISKWHNELFRKLGIEDCLREMGQ